VDTVTTSTEIDIVTDDGPMPGYVTEPDGEPRGTVVVVQEAFGVTAHIQDVTRRIAEAGWRGVAPALFHRQGSPVLAYDDYEAVMPLMAELTAGGLTTDLHGVVAFAESRGTSQDKIGIVGFCMGGTVSCYAATLYPLGAAVTYYGGGVAAGRFGLPSLVDLAPSLDTPWLGLYGDQDHGIPVEDVEALRAAAASAGVPTEIVRYPDAEHGFNCNDRASYNPPAATDAWARTLAWFDRHLGG
jgi:carboxymethylenebutenolidase